MESTFTLPIAPLVQLSFYLLILIFSIFTAVLYYHWQNYSTDGRVTLITYAAFGFVSIPLIIIMAYIAFTLF